MAADPDNDGDLWRWWSASVRQSRSLAKDMPLFHRGDPVRAMFRVEEGLVRLERRTFDGNLLVLHVSRPGELIAEGSLFAEAYHCDARAVEPTVVSACPTAALLGAMAQDSARALQFARLVARQLQNVRLRLELRNVRSARERSLLYLQLRADSTNRLALEVPLQDLAAEIGLTREAFYRALTALEREGAISRERGAIRVRSADI